MVTRVGAAIVETMKFESGILLVLKEGSDKYALPNSPAQEGETSLDAVIRTLTYELGVNVGIHSEPISIPKRDYIYDCYVVEVAGVLVPERLANAGIKSIGFLSNIPGNRLPVEYLEDSVISIKNMYLDSDQRIHSIASYCSYRLEFDRLLIREWKNILEDKRSRMSPSWAE